MLYFCNLCKAVATCAFDIHINITIEVVDGPPCIFHVKILGCFPCSNSKKRILWQSILVKECQMIKLLGDLKVFGTFHLSPIGELVKCNEKFQPREVVVKVVKKVVGDSS